MNISPCLCNKASANQSWHWRCRLWAEDAPLLIITKGGTNLRPSSPNSKRREWAKLPGLKVPQCYPGDSLTCGHWQPPMFPSSPGLLISAISCQFPAFPPISLVTRYWAPSCMSTELPAITRPSDPRPRLLIRNLIYNLHCTHKFKHVQFSFLVSRSFCMA